MKALVNKRTWTVTIEYGNEFLAAPNTRDPITNKSYSRHWLPCDHCGTLEAVKTTVVSFICEQCTKPCHHTDCCLEYWQHFDKNGNKTPCEPKEVF